FFQAEDGIRDATVTGVQTCALPIYLEAVRYQARVAPLVDVLAAVGLAIVMWLGATRVLAGVLTTGDLVIFFAYITNLYSPIKGRSEERRVGKEGDTVWSRAR